MAPGIPSRQARLIEELSDPRRGEEWFEDLPGEYRADLEHDWKANLRHRAELQQGARLGMGRDVLVAALIFATFDLLCPHRSAGSFLAALVVGGLWGFGGTAIDAGRLLGVVVGMPLFLVVGAGMRGGVSVMHLILTFLLGCVLAYYGMKREDRVFE